MDFPKADLIIHPVRLRILQTLAGEPLTTREIAVHLPEVPESSLYRHLKLLLDGELIVVANAQLVNGIQEKWYRLAQPPRLGPDDVSGMTTDDHLRYFTNYILATLRDFVHYLQQAADANGHVDMLADRTGYTETYLFASQAELDAFQGKLQEAFLLLAENGPAPGRHKHKFVFITHPL